MCSLVFFNTELAGINIFVLFDFFKRCVTILSKNLRHDGCGSDFSLGEPSVEEIRCEAVKMFYFHILERQLV